jgi:hypothetical protein
LFRLPVIVCLLVYLALYIVAPLWAPVKDGERGIRPTSSMPTSTAP